MGRHDPIERRALRRSVAAALLLLFVASPALTARAARLHLPALHAEPDPAGGRIVDARGREVLLRGVNVNALVGYWAYGPLQTVYPFDAADAEVMAGIGWNVVRLLVSWSRLEPAPGAYDRDYLREVARAVDVLARHGLYAIIDFHQDAWSATLAARPDEVCPAGSQPAFGWDGAPAWATLDGGAPHCFTLVRELSPAVQNAFAAFWANAPGPGGVGIRTRYARMVGWVARRFAHLRSVAGYDVMNEPSAFTPEQIAVLDDFYAEVLAEVRTAERRRHGFPHLLFFEPSILWSDTGAGTPEDFPHDANVVFAPHVYRGGITSGPIEPADFARARDDAAGFDGAPVLVGEWGSDPDRALDPADVYFREHQALQDEYRFGATLWTWRESCGDPHKAADARAGRVPEVWGEWDVDCATNTVDGLRQALVDQLTRAYVRAAPGRLERTSYDPASGAFEAAGSGARARTRLVAYYPARLHGQPALVATGLRRVRAIPASDGGVYVVGRALGGTWSLAASAAAAPAGRAR